MLDRLSVIGLKQSGGRKLKFVPLKHFFTFSDNHASLCVRVCEGEREH